MVSRGVVEQWMEDGLKDSCDTLMPRDIEKKRYLSTTAWDTAEAHLTKLSEHPRFDLYEQAALLAFCPIASELLQDTGVDLLTVPDEISDRQLKEKVRVLTAIVDESMGFGYIAGQKDRLVHGRWAPLFRDLVAPRANVLLVIAQEANRLINAPQDKWHMSVTLAYLLQPELALATVHWEFWFPRPQSPLTFREVQYESASSAPIRVELVGAKQCHQIRKYSGGKVVHSRSGPRPNSVKRLKPEHQALIDYIRIKTEGNVSAAMIAADDEARRLYRRWKDVHAELNVRIVRDIKRKYLK